MDSPPVRSSRTSRVVSSPSVTASARSARASSVPGSAHCTTRTRAPTAWSARATTHPSPPLFPPPFATSTPCESCVANRAASGVAAAAPARCMSAGVGSPAAMAAASAAAAPPASATNMSGTLCPGAGAIKTECTLRCRRSGELRAPRIVALERLIEVEDFAELVPRVRRLAHQQLEIHEREDDVAEVCGRVHAPVIKDEARHDAEAVQRQIATRQGKLAPTDVATLRQALLAKFQGAEDKEICALVESRLAPAESVHHDISG